MNWRQLELLRRVVDNGSFTKAAQASGVSQPAVSRAMAQLGQQLGAPLFRRVGRRAVPTEQALQLARAMRDAGDALARVAAAPAPAAARAQSGTVRLGVAPAAGLMYGPAMVATLAGGGWRQRLSLVTGPAPVLLAALVRRELDAAIAPRPRGLGHPELSQRVMYVSHPAVYCRDGHPLQGAASLRDITGARWAVAGAAGTPGNVIEEAFRVRRWAAPLIAVQCADYGMLMQIVATSDLLGVISHPLLAARAREQGVRPIQIAEGLPNYEVCLFWHRDAVVGRRGLRQVIGALKRASAEGGGA